MNQPSPSTPDVDPVADDAVGEPSCNVVVFALPDDPGRLGDLLVEQLGVHPTDAHIQAHAVPGLLPGRFTRRQAAELVKGVRQLGVSAEIVEDADIPRLEPARTIHHARCTERGLEIVDLRGRVEPFIPWNEVRLLSVGYVPLETARHSLVEPAGLVTSGRRTWASSVEVASLSGPEAWLICGQAGDAYRIDNNLMNYEYLGDRMTGSATRNFHLFVEDVVAGAQDAYLTPAIRAFLDHGLLRHFEFRGSEELQRYTQFHLLIANRARQAAAPQC
ncbi:MAG: hypothetical protein ACE5KM_15145 [Planctomycetaceae bacterium]